MTMWCLGETMMKLSQRLLLIPRVQSNFCCAMGRDYSSKGPVKYIPKKTSLNQDGEARSLPAKRLYKKGNNARQVSNTEQLVDSANNRCGEQSVSTSFDNYHPFHEFHSTVEGEDQVEGNRSFAKVEADEVIDEIDVDLLCASADELVEETDEFVVKNMASQRRQDVEKMAIELLASRAYTAQELKKKLHGKNLSPEIIDAVIADFQSRGIINDFLYAETFSRSRWMSSSWGPRRVKQALHKRGVSEGDAEKAIELVFECSDEEDRRSGIPMSQRSIAQLYAQALKQWQRSFGAPKEKRKSRIIQWLRYRGFNWTVVSYILKKLESEYSNY